MKINLKLSKNRPCLSNKSAKSAFTLIEILAVISIIAVLSTIALMGGLGTLMAPNEKGTITSIRDTIDFARNYAITYGVDTYVVFGDSTTSGQLDMYCVVAALDKTPPTTSIAETDTLDKVYTAIMPWEKLQGEILFSNNLGLTNSGMAGSATTAHNGKFFIKINKYSKVEESSGSTNTLSDSNCRNNLILQIYNSQTEPDTLGFGAYKINPIYIHEMTSKPEILKIH